MLGSVATVPFSMPGTDEVPDNLEPFLEDHKAFLLTNHGAATIGTNLYDALFRMEALENVAKVILTARLLGRTCPMPDSAFDQLSQTYLNGKI